MKVRLLRPSWLVLQNTALAALVGFGIAATAIFLDDIMMLTQC